MCNWNKHLILSLVFEMWYVIFVCVLLCDFSYGAAIVTPKIVGGVSAYVGQFPYHVALKTIHNAQFTGSGSIISADWILTARKSANGGDMMVVVGSIYLDTGFGYWIERIVFHPDYDYSLPNKHNIALLKVSGSIRFNSNVQPISLSNVIKLPDGISALFTGWGATYFVSEENKVAPNDLQYTTLHTVSISQCKSLGSGENVTDSDIFIQCMSSDRIRDGPCEGDEGGPLVYDNEQIGVDFMSQSCKSYNGSANMFTKIGPLRPWIRRITGV